MTKPPLDPFSEVVDERRHLDKEWYSWLAELATAATQLQSSIPPLQTQITALQDSVTTLQGSVTALQGSVTALQSSVTTLQATSPPGLVFISSQLVTSPVATINFTTGINNTYDAYRFDITRLKPSVDAAQVWMQMSTNGGSTWKNTSNNWNWVYGYVGGGGSAFGYNMSLEGNPGYFRIGGATASAWGNSSEVMLYPSVAGLELNKCSWRSVDWSSINGGTFQVIGAGNEASDTTPCNAVRFLFSGGNIVSGRVSMYGLRKT